MSLLHIIILIYFGLFSILNGSKIYLIDYNAVYLLTTTSREHNTCTNIYPKNMITHIVTEI